MTSLNKISEQIKYILGAGDIQPILASVIDAYSSAVKKEWYENVQDGSYEVDGAFISTMGKDGSLSPVLDTATNMYYIEIPSSYLRLPSQRGINYVGFLLGQTKEFIMLGSGSVSMWSGLKSSVLGGSQTYFVEGTQMYFPKMTSTTNGNIMLKLAIALDKTDVDEELNIPRSTIDNIVNMVVAKFASRKPQEEKVIV